MERRLRRLWTLTRRHLGGIGAAVLTVGLVYSGSIEWLEYRALDQFFEIRGPRVPATPIVIVAIDTSTLVELSTLVDKPVQWPFPRAMHGRVIDRISADRPLAIGVDILFDSPSSRGPKDDAALGAAIARAGNVVLAAAYVKDKPKFYTRIDFNMPIEAIRAGATAVAPVDLFTDDDGHVRRTPVRVRVPDPKKGWDWWLGFDAQLHQLAAKAGLPAKPLPAGTEILINIDGPPKTFARESYHAVLRGEVAPETFRDKIVLLGATDKALHDIHPTAFAVDRTMPGIEIHANAIETFIRGNAIREIPPVASTALAVIAALAGSALVVRFRALRALLVTIVLWGLVAAVAYGLFVSTVWVRTIAFTVGLILGYGSTATENFIRTQRERRRMSLFFSQEVVRTLMRERDEGSLTSSRRVVTVLFSDIRDFTSLSEKLPPEQVNEMVLDYLTEMTEIVEKNGGVVDKYIGDCVMALYNAPLANPEHAANAVRTGLELQERALSVSAKWEAKIGVPIRCGVGINTGEAVVGFLGSRKRPAYTAIGDAVNLAARLEPLTKDHGASIIISEDTHEHVKGRFPTRPLGEVTVKGKLLPVKIYGVVPASVRKHPRVALDAAATLTAIGDGQSCRARTAEISAGGLALTGVPPDWEVGRRIQIRLDGGGLSRQIVAEGTIVSRRGDAAGVQFTTVEDAAKPAIAEWVARGRETDQDDDQ
ncbi:MAG: hypothetical protein DME04_12725 [Candidatus Rokuibacteriota bacterium]|nr:MAG: hypothetical protein DME04_12725 [Candidatus Rokubacteria bacterium]